MSYHNTSPTTSAAARQSTTNAQGQTAPAGYHYMPDGSLMLDTEHATLYGSKVIKSFSLDTGNIKAAGERRKFTILGDKGAVFSLEIKEGDRYYNFKTGLFDAAKARLVNASVEGSSYSGSISFPRVAAGAQYDIYLFTENGTKHAEYNEVRLPDNSIDINSTTGSNSNLIQKVIYQTLDVTLTLSGYAPNNTITGIGIDSKVITTSRNASTATIPFSFIVATGVSNTLSITKQPANNDVMAFLSLTPISNFPIEGENIYPAVTAANKVVNGAVSSGTNVTMDDDFTGRWAVGDRITGNAALDARKQATAVTVAAINVGSNAKVFTMSEAIAIADDETLSFSNRRNYRWPIDNIDRLQEGMRAVKGSIFLNPPTIKEYLEETIAFEGEQGEIKIEKVKIKPSESLGAIPVITRDATTKIVTTAQTGNITFSEQAVFAFSNVTAKIYSYGPDEISRLVGYDVEFSNLNAVVNDITTTTTAAVSASTTIPVTSKVGIVAPTTQTVDGAITSSQYVVLDSVDGLNVGQSLYVISAGTLLGTPIITTINETTKRITLSTPQTFADGITLTFPNSIISGIGIDPGVINPYVASIASLNLTASVAQTLEDAQTFAFAGAGSVVTITGNIKINKVGNENLTLRFDVDKFLTKHTN